MLKKPTVKAVDRIRKKYGLSHDDPLSAAQYREACSMGSEKSGNSNFSFQYKLLKLTESCVMVEVAGNHLSKNSVDSLSFREKLAYKKAFKQGAKEMYLLERKRLRSFPVMKNAKISFAFYSKRSRDHDNNSENIKRVQDTLVSLGFLIDDKRENLELDEVKEIIANVPKIIVKLWQ